MSSKSEARKNIAEYLDGLEEKGNHECFELGVRLNSLSSGLLLDDLKELSKAKHLPQAFMIPKVDSPEDLAGIWDFFRNTYGASRIQDSVIILNSIH